jgi:putative transposase
MVSNLAPDPLQDVESAGGQNRAAATDTRAHHGRESASESNLRWRSDGLEIRCWRREMVREAFAPDCCYREAIGSAGTTRGIDAGKG